MKTLMRVAIEDMRKNGMVFSLLCGQRQRYEYFGYAPAGSTVSFVCTETNMNHILGKQWEPRFALEKIHIGDQAILDQIYIMHQAKSLRMYRNRDSLFDILSSWNAEIFSIVYNGLFTGYFIHKLNDTNNTSCINEIQLQDISHLPDVLGHFFCKKGMGIPKLCRNFR